MGKFLIIFSLLLTGLFALMRLSWADQFIVTPFTEYQAYLSGWMLAMMDQDATAIGAVLANTHNGFAVTIAPGCNGLEAVIILVSAILGFPAGWKYKTMGIVFGLAAIVSMNILRIISLFYFGQWNQTLFDWAHLYVWPALIILDALVVFLVWLQRMAPAVSQRNESCTEEGQS